jgi:hypothetical protein
MINQVKWSAPGGMNILVGVWCSSMVACGGLEPRSGDFGDRVEGHRVNQAPYDLHGDADAPQSIPDGDEPARGATDPTSRASDDETNHNASSACQVWQDCPADYGDRNSGMECVAQSCVCDPQNQWAQVCTQEGGYWSAGLCMCYFASIPPPQDTAEDCDWVWDYFCEGDVWIDTSYWDEQCGYTYDDEWRCEDVWVEQGYWQNGDCLDGRWTLQCD